MKAAAQPERLHKFIARCGYCSRRRAEQLIGAGEVTVNGECVTQLGTKITPGRDVVAVHGEELRTPERLTIVLNKPKGCLTTMHDPHGRRTVMELLPDHVREAGVRPAGRLDYESEGLLVLTNDGELLQAITHPSFQCQKQYRVRLGRTPKSTELDRLGKGLFVRELGKKTRPAQLGRMRKESGGEASLTITIHEGMKRQVRRMFATLDIPVLRLRRMSIGGLAIGDLPAGGWRELSGSEVSKLLGR